MQYLNSVNGDLLKNEGVMGVVICIYALHDMYLCVNTWDIGIIWLIFSVNRDFGGMGGAEREKNCIFEGV